MSKEKQQTAVEWLISKTPIEALKLINHEVIEKAKEMEKQQMKKAFIDGDYLFYTKEDAEDYYNKTYGK